MTDYKQLCAELLDELQYQTGYSIAEELKERARAALAEPETIAGSVTSRGYRFTSMPKRFTVEEISNLSQHRENYIVEDHRDGEIQLDGHFSRADLQQLADSIPTPMRAAAKTD